MACYKHECALCYVFDDLNPENEIEVLAYNPNSYCGIEYECTDYPSDTTPALNFDFDMEV